MNIELNLKKGLDLNIEGEPDPSTIPGLKTIIPEMVAITPDDFPGLNLKPLIKEGDKVSTGSHVLQDKHNPSIYVNAPAAGTVKAIVRGERRKLEQVIIEVSPDDSASISYDNSITDKESAQSFLQESGLWAFIRQRPYNIVAQPDSAPRDIFVNALDTAPLAPDTGLLLENCTDDLSAGVRLLSKLTSGTVYIGRRSNGGIHDIDGAVMVDIKGPHPAGNAGVIAANIKPVNKGEVIWTMDAFTLARIGNAVRNGKVDYTCTVAITGSEVAEPGYIKTIIGAGIEPLIKGRIKDTDKQDRIISGNVLTGHQVTKDSFLRYPYYQITVIPEGNDVEEFMGWASLSPKKMSVSRSFPGHFLKKLFKPDARLLGGRRAMIMSGEYDKVVPMDIMTEYLVKAILSKDIEKMESLGIYEVAPEDFALAEYVCTSKLPIQSIIANGLQYLRKELE